MVKLSIIIPYYETYELTMKLLRELAIQRTDEVEIILIDDYNDDRFNQITEDNLILYGLKDAHILKVRHIENQGVAKSRNEGIELAQGKYIAFIDCDDQITMDYIDTLLDAIDKYDEDVINFNWYDMTDHIENRKPHNYAPWKAIYKKDIIPRFREDMEYGSEDIVFQNEIDSGKYTIRYLDKMLYLYNSNRVGSLYWKKTHQ
jgi:glycosyltransferase involved in cell wall biosynthesis